CPSSAARDTNVAAREWLACPSAPNIGRYRTGSGVGIDALGSPMSAATIRPPTRIRSGFTPKNAGDQRTRSARLPTAIEPMYSATPWAMAGLIVYFATYLRARRLSFRDESAASDPREAFMTCAVCHVRVIT